MSSPKFAKWMESIPSQSMQRVSCTGGGASRIWMTSTSWRSSWRSSNRSRRCWIHLVQRGLGRRRHRGGRGQHPAAGGRHHVDEANGSRLPQEEPRSDIAEELVTEEIHLNCIDKSSIRPGTTVTKLSRFLDKVITRQFYTDTRRSSVSNNVVITSPPFIYYQIRLRDDNLSKLLFYRAS